jgi:hypothetical protein
MHLSHRVAGENKVRRRREVTRIAGENKVREGLGGDERGGGGYWEGKKTEGNG